MIKTQPKTNNIILLLRYDCSFLSKSNNKTIQKMTSIIFQLFLHPFFAIPFVFPVFGCFMALLCTALLVISNVTQCQDIKTFADYLSYTPVIFFAIELKLLVFMIISFLIFLLIKLFICTFFKLQIYISCTRKKKMNQNCNWYYSVCRYISSFKPRKSIIKKIFI